MKLSTVLVAFDFSPASLAAFNRARTLVERPGRLHLCHMVDSTIDSTSPRHSTPAEMEQYRQKLEGDARARLSELAKQASESDVGTEIHVGFGPPAEEIVKLGARVGADLIALGAHGKNVFDRLLLGSVAEDVSRLSASPTLIVRELPTRATDVARVVVAVDLEEASHRPIEVASTVARRLGAPLEAVHVIDFRHLPLPVTGSFDPAMLNEETRRAIEAVPKEVELALLDAGVVRAAIKVLGGVPGHELARYVTERDLLVCGTHGRGAIGRFVFGSVAIHLLRTAPCPMIVTRLDATG